MGQSQIIRESSRERLKWDFIALALVLVSCVIVTLQLAFTDGPSLLSSLFIYAIDLFFLADIRLNLRTSYRQHGVEVTDADRIGIRYKRRLMRFDLIGCVPIDLLFWLLGSPSVFGLSLVLLLRSLRLVRVVRLYVILNRWESMRWANVAYLRIVRLGTTIGLLVHFAACTWFLSAVLAGFSNNSWVTRVGIVEVAAPQQYLRSLYWTVTTMTTVGYGDITPVTNVEYMISIFVMVLGASVYAVIIGNIASLFSNIDAAKAAHWNRIESVSQYLRDRDVPADLSDKVRNFYEYLWSSHGGHKEAAFLDDFPPSLKLEILQHLAKDLISEVPIFKHCSRTLRDELLNSLHPQSYPPDSFVVKEGEPGDCIYFLSSGTAEILSQDGAKSHGFFTPGDYFGDLTMLLGERRTGAVITREYCELFILYRRDFERIREDYGEFREVLKTVSSEQSEKRMGLLLEEVTL
jgi:hypothetical protein